MRTVRSHTVRQWISVYLRAPPLLLSAEPCAALVLTPYRPQSNGQKEIFVDAFKQALLKSSGEGTTVEKLIIPVGVPRNSKPNPIRSNLPSRSADEPQV